MKLRILLVISSLLAGLGASAGAKSRHSGHRVDGKAVNHSGLPGRVLVAEGTINGGGGKGVLCSREGVETVETLDLYEARASDRHLISVPASEEEAFDLAVQLLARQLWNPDTIPMDEYVARLKKDLQEKWLKDLHFQTDGKHLARINDSLEVVREKNCQSVQVAVYYNESSLLIDKSYWDLMDNLSKAALLLHELVYYIERENGETNSLNTRKLVGLLFSREGVRPKTDGVPVSDDLTARCRVYDNNDMTVGYAFAYETEQDSEKGVEIVFNYLKNQTFLFRTSAFYRSLTLENLDRRSQEHKSFKGDVPLEIDTFFSSNTRAQLKISEDGSVKLGVINLKTGESLSNLKLSCDYSR